jgi:hypothetical protein
VAHDIICRNISPSGLQVLFEMIIISTKLTEKYIWPLFGDIYSVIKIITIDTPEMKQYQALFMV